MLLQGTEGGPPSTEAWKRAVYKQPPRHFAVEVLPPQKHGKLARPDNRSGGLDYTDPALQEMHTVLACSFHLSGIVTTEIP